MADPVVHLTNGLPDAGTGNITTLGQTLLDGANITQGATTDAAVAAGATGSLSAKLRSISRDLVANIVLAAGANIIGAVTQSGAWVLSAGAAIIGKVGIDQTTPGTTDSVTVAVAQGAGAAIGTTTGAAVTTDVAGTMQQYLRGLVKLFTSATFKATAPVNADNALVVAIHPLSVNANGQAAMAASAPVTIASNQATTSVAQDTNLLANNGAMLTVAAKVKITNGAAATTTTLVPLSAAKKVRVLSLYLVCTGANTVTFQSHTTTANNDAGCAYAANGGISLPFNPVGWFDTTAGEALDMVTGLATQVSGQLTFVYV